MDSFKEFLFSDRGKLLLALVLTIAVLYYFKVYSCGGGFAYGGGYGSRKKINGVEKFISGLETPVARYDQILPLDDPKYVTPQQKDFQMSLSEHSALDPNMQSKREEVKTQLCTLGEKCFDTQEYHELNYKMKSSPNIINSKVPLQKNPLPCVRYLRHEQNKVLPANAVSTEMRADLFTDIVIPDLFFEYRQDSQCRL